MEAAQLERYLRTLAGKDQAAHAYIIEGDKAVSKAIALAFAEALAGSKADILIPEQEKPNLFSVEDVRTQINGNVHIRPYSGKKKVYILENADLMNVQAQNALLKTIEEPPEYVVMLLLTENTEVFLQTILSRCVKLSVYREEEAGFDEENEAVRLLETFLKTGSRPDTSAVIQLTDEIKNYRPDLEKALEVLRKWMRDVLMYKSGLPKEKLFFRNDITYVRFFSQSMSYEGINRILLLIDEAKARLRANVNPELTMETVFIAIQEEL